MASWKFTGDNPLLFTPSLLGQLHDYSMLANTPGASAEAIGGKRDEISRALGLLPPSEMSPFATAGQRLQTPLQNQFYPGANDITHTFDKYMPPIRAGEGIYITGKPDVVGLGASGLPSYVHDIKTTFLNPQKASREEFIRGQGPNSIWGRINQYTQKFQNLYATAFGLPEITYRGVGFLNPNDPASAAVGASTQAGKAPSLGEVESWAKSGLATLNQLGPRYIQALERKSAKGWENQVQRPMEDWAKKGVLPVGMERATSIERDMFYGMEAASLFASQDAERRAEGEMLKSYIRGQPTTNSGFSIEDKYSAARGVRAITMGGGSSHSGRGAGEGMDAPFSPRLSMWSKYSSAMSKGDRAAAARWSSWNSRDTSWDDFFSLATEEYNEKQATRERSSFEESRHKAEFSRLRAGDDEGASIIRATESLSELESALIKVADSSRRAAESERNRDKALGTIASVQPYDWTKWYKARGEAWGNIQQASSWMPNFITSPANRFGTAAMQVYGAEVARTKGPYDALMQGLMPMGAAAGALIPGVGPMIGAAVGGSAAALSQIIGNIGEGRIRAGGLELSSKLNMWGGVTDIASSAISLSLKALLMPLDLFGKGLKIAIPSLLGFGVALASSMNKGFSLMNNLGNPLSAMTGGSSYEDFQRSQLMDVMSGSGAGSTANSVQKLAAMRHGFFGLGRFDTNQMLSASMLGQFGMFYNNNTSNGYSDYNGMVTRLARQFSGQGIGQQARSMYYLQDIDSTMATHVQTLLNQYRQSGSTAMDWGKYNDPSTYGISYRFLNQGEREKFRTENFAYQSIKSSIDIDKIRLASALWNRFGEGILSWVQGLYEKIGSGASLKDIVGYVATGARDLWDQALKPIVSDGFKKIASMAHRGINELIDAAPSLAAALKPAFLHISDMAFSVFWDIGESLWDTFRKLLYNISSVQIKPGGIIKALQGGGSWADAISIVPPVSQILRDANGSITTDPRNPNRFYDKESGAGVYYEMDPMSGKYYMGHAGQQYRTEISSTGAGAIAAWQRQLPANKYTQREWEQIQGIIDKANRVAVAKGLGGASALEGLSALLGESGYGSLAVNADKFVETGGFDPLRLMLKGMGVGDKETARAKFRSGLESSLNAVNASELYSGLGNVAHTSVDVLLKIIDGDGKVLLEKAITALGDGMSSAVEGAIDVLGDLGNRVERLSDLQINRTEQRLLSVRASGALR